MADESYLRTWVSDKLMSLIGYSKSVAVQYVIRLCKHGKLFFFCSNLRSYFVRKALCFFFHALVAKESSSPADLMRKLVEFGFSSSTETHSFAEDMYAKVPHKQAASSVSS